MADNAWGEDHVKAENDPFQGDASDVGVQDAQWTEEGEDWDAEQWADESMNEEASKADEDEGYGWDNGWSSQWGQWTTKKQEDDSYGHGRESYGGGYKYGGGGGWKKASKYFGSSGSSSNGSRGHYVKGGWMSSGGHFSPRLQQQWVFSVFMYGYIKGKEA